MSKKSEQPSILKFFSKSPKPGASTGTPNVSTPSTPATGTARKAALIERRENVGSSTPQSSRKRPADSIADVKKSSSTCPFEELDLIWAGLDGYPMWPALVCRDPGAKQITRINRGVQKVHVQFFDDPPQRAWIRLSDCAAFLNDKHPKLSKITDPKLQQSVDWAMTALSESKSDRRNYIVALLASDDDADNEDENDRSIGNNPKDSKRRRIVQSDDEVDMEKGTESIKKATTKGNTSKGNTSKVFEVDMEEFDDDFDIGSDISEDEYVPGKEEKQAASSSESELSTVESENENFTEEEENDDDSIAEEPVSRKRGGGGASKKTEKSTRSRGNTSKSSKSVGNLSMASFNMSTVCELSEDDDENNAGLNSEGGSSKQSNGGYSTAWPHLSFDFLQPEKIRDAKGRRPTDSDYDSSTVFVPKDFIKTQTPAHRQWWKIKSEHYDKIIFFKVGKFYELFHMDAVIGANVANLSFMSGGNYAHAGFPERSYAFHSKQLIKCNYKCVRVEQMETPEGRNERCKGMKSVDKVVSRSICRINTPGTSTSNAFDGDIENPNSAFLLALVEKTKDRDLPEFGMCLIDTSIGRFVLGQWQDDRCLSSLRTLLANCPPSELLLNNKSVGKHTLTVLKNCAPDAVIGYRSAPSQFWTACETLKYLIEGKFFRKETDANLDVDDEEKSNDSMDSKQARLPETLLNMTDPTDCLNLTPLATKELALSAFGAVICYLKECLIDEELLSLGLITEYKDSNSLAALHSAGGGGEDQRLMLDSVALKNLEVFENSSGGVEGTLLNSIDFCSTKFGKRRLRAWLCAPLCNPVAIRRRQDAVENLLQLDLADIRSMMKSFPDLERSLAKIHSQALSRRNKSHPDSQAVMFDAAVYSKRKIIEFLDLLKAFRKSQQVMRKIYSQKSQVTSSLLRELMTETTDGGLFPVLDPILNFFDKAFDHELARSKGEIIPKKGVNRAYEKALDEISQVKKELDEYLREQTRKFGCTVTYAKAVKLQFQLEVPEHAAKKAGSEYELQTSRKGFKRFYTSFIRDRVERFKKLDEAKEIALQESMRILLARFDRDYAKFGQAINCLALLDCLMSLTQFARNLKQKLDSDQICRPEFVEAIDGPVLELEKARHPTLINLCDNFVPNDLMLDRQLMLLTGPNMGGKSTLMRQTGLIVMLAQLGSFVPASRCRLTPVDRVFTRLGASDRILQGESTFYVELSEAATVLKHATINSLVLLDELGRGTSTWDGCSVAAAVARHLTDRVRCRCIFSTHYHQLVKRLESNAKVLCRHMACEVDEYQENDLVVPRLIFLYQLADGACPDSHGFHAAQMASIPQHVVKRAMDCAREAERHVLIRRLCSQMIKENLKISDFRVILASLVPSS